MADKALFVMNKHVHLSEISAAYPNPSLGRDLETRYVRPVLAAAGEQPSLISTVVSSKTCDQPQPFLFTATPELPGPKKCGDAKIPTMNGTITLPIPNDSTSSLTSSKGEEGDKAKPSGSQDRSLWKMHPVPSTVHVPAASSTAIADAIPNTRPEAATPSVPRPSHSISVVPLTSNDVHPATTAADASFWQVNSMLKVLNYFCTKYPKLVSAVSTVLITAGSIALHPGVAACVGGPTLAQHAVQAVGAVAVGVSKWLRTALNSATTKAAA